MTLVKQKDGSLGKQSIVYSLKLGKPGVRKRSKGVCNAIRLLLNRGHFNEWSTSTDHVVSLPYNRDRDIATE